MPEKSQAQARAQQPAPQVQEQPVPQESLEEDGGLSIGTQAAIGVLFLGLPFLGMGVEALGWSEPGLVLAALGAGSLGLGTKVLLDRGRGHQLDPDQEEDDQEPDVHLGPTTPHFRILDRLHQANWGALLRPVNEGRLPQLPAPAPQEQTPDTGKTTMNFGETLRPEANRIFSGRKVLFGVSDAGKSNAVAVIVEEIGGPAPYGFEAPLFLLDTEDEYSKLNDKRFLARPLGMDSSKLRPNNAFEFAQWAVHNLRQVIVNLQSYEDHEAAWVIINLIKGVRAYEEAHDVRLPCEFILDEATVWLPQNRSQSTLNRFMVDDPDGQAAGVEPDGEDDGDDENEDDAQKTRDKPKQVSLLSLLERAVFDIVVRRGRKRGIGFTLATQRIAEINKSALQASWTFLMRQTQAADFREYKKFGISSKEAMEMQAGEAYVFPPGKSVEHHRFRLRRSPHGANNPGLAELRQHQQRVAAQPVSQRPALVAPTPAATRQIPEQHADIPWAATAQAQGAPRRLYSLPPMEPLAPNPLRQKDPEPEIEEMEEEEPEEEELTERERQYEQVLQLWGEGRRSIRSMMDPLGLNFNQTRELLEEMDELGLIPWRKKGDKASV